MNLNSEGFDAQYALRSCLRTKAKCSELPDVIYSWCLICKENTRINGNHRVVVDHNPRWTLGDNPLYLEKGPEFQSCFDSGCRLSRRFVPVDAEVSSIMPRIVSDLASIIVDLDRDIRWLVKDSVLPPFSQTSFWLPTPQLPHNDGSIIITRTIHAKSLTYTCDAEQSSLACFRGLPPDPIWPESPPNPSLSPESQLAGIRPIQECRGTPQSARH